MQSYYLHGLFFNCSNIAGPQPAHLVAGVQQFIQRAARIYPAIFEHNDLNKALAISSVFRFAPSQRAQNETQK
jgi:hypothetical protein